MFLIWANKNVCGYNNTTALKFLSLVGMKSSQNPFNVSVLYEETASSLNLVWLFEWMCFLTWMYYGESLRVKLRLPMLFHVNRTQAHCFKMLVMYSSDVYSLALKGSSTVGQNMPHVAMFISTLYFLVLAFLDIFKGMFSQLML